MFSAKVLNWRGHLLLPCGIFEGIDMAGKKYGKARFPLEYFG